MLLLRDTAPVVKGDASVLRGARIVGSPAMHFWNCTTYGSEHPAHGSCSMLESSWSRVAAKESSLPMFRKEPRGSLAATARMQSANATAFMSREIVQSDWQVNNCGQK